MPYASDAQRRFMHVRHPEIAAKWDAEIRAAKKKRKVKKASSKVGWLQPLAIGVAGGAMANQFPSVEEEVRRRKRKSKGKISKLAVSVHDDPYFNQEVAQKTFDLVMKMDDDAAEMFCEMVIGQIHEDIVEKNLGTLQRHLDVVVAKQLDGVKQAMRAISKSNDPKTYAQWEEIVKDWESRLHPRGQPGNVGQFRANVSHHQVKPLSRRVADELGLVPTDAAERRRYYDLSPTQRAQYQDEYRQLAHFLSTVTASSTGGDHNVYLHMHDRAGHEFRQPLAGGAAEANQHLLNPHLTLDSVEATPATLTVAGSAFGLAQAMGMDYGPSTPGRIETGQRAMDELGSFRRNWDAETENKASNARLYARIGATGEYLGAVAPPGKIKAAAKLAEVVGSHGPEAEAVIGPTARKTAYRYRGTEKAPDPHLVALYGRAISGAKAGGAEAEPAEIRTRPTERPGVETANRRPTRVKGGTRVPQPLAITQMAARRALDERRAPTWDERAAGRRVIEDQLRFNVPSQELYELQAQSGHIPPSEGVMLNADGQIAAQAIGYGDDHYLPFNLKNLKALKGGEYIRTRSVGGLTAEDVYTGLISGARRVTVVSRSGTFSVEFEPDFRGGRRYNDKAARMTRRYEQLLDAVQSKQVMRAALPAPVEQAIRSEVATEFPGESRAVLREKTKQRIKEYREDPDIGPEDEKLARLVYEQGMRDNPSRDEVAWLQSARQMIRQGKAYNYQLDAQGYEAAQDALEEQFPYYIKSMPVIEREGEKVSGEPDKGYVEPGRNRPTAARAGLFGTETNRPAGKENMKFSASQANYQRGRGGMRGAGDITPSRPQREPAQGAAPTSAPPAAADANSVDRAIAAGENRDDAVELFNALRAATDRGVLDQTFAQRHEVLNMDPAVFAHESSNPETMEQFRTAVHDEFAHRLTELPTDLRTSYLQFQRSSGALTRQAYDQRFGFHWTPEPPEFRERAYGSGATDEERQAERTRIDNRTGSLTTGRQLSSLNDGELHNELNALRRLHSVMRSTPELGADSNAEQRRAVALRLFGNTYDRHAIGLMTGSPEGVERRMEDIHRMRVLNQGVPDAQRGGGVTHRFDELLTPGQQAIGEMNRVNELRTRLATLQRYRQGMAFADEHPNPDVDAAIADVEHVLGLAEGGNPPSEDDYDTALTMTEDLARNAPVDTSQLSHVQRGIFERGREPRLFHTDPVTGVVTYQPPR